MGIFFRDSYTPAQQVKPQIISIEQPASGGKPTIEFKQDNGVGDFEQNMQELQVPATPQPGPPRPRQFIWVRLVVALALLVGIGATIIYAAHDPKLEKFSESLLHAFEVLLGGLIGLLLGEGQAK